MVTGDDNKRYSQTTTEGMKVVYNIFICYKHSYTHNQVQYCTTRYAFYYDLRLLWHTLKSIEEEQHGHAEKCRMEMLAVWL